MRLEIHLTAGQKIDLPGLSQEVRKAMLGESARILQEGVSHLFNVRKGERASETGESYPGASATFWKFGTALELAGHALNGIVLRHADVSKLASSLGEDTREMQQYAERNVSEKNASCLISESFGQFLIRINERSREILDIIQKIESESQQFVKICIDEVSAHQNHSGSDATRMSSDTVRDDQQNEIAELQKKVRQLSHALEGAKISPPKRVIIGWETPTNYCDPEPIYGEVDDTSGNVNGTDFTY